MFGITKAKGEICQYSYDEISALAIFLLHIELLPLYIIGDRQVEIRRQLVSTLAACLAKNRIENHLMCCLPVANYKFKDNSIWWEGPSEGKVRNNINHWYVQFSSTQGKMYRILKDNDP
jgi:hypothetical protein